MKKYTVAVVGVGAVGAEMLKVLDERKFPTKSVRVLARTPRTEEIAGRTYQVEPTTEAAFNDVDIALFAGTEGEKGASQQFGWLAAQKGAIVIDNGDDFRMDPRVPLVVPEVNAEALRDHQGFISNPNCSTVQMVMVLAPLHRVARVRRVVAVTYQAVSGTGRGAINELADQVTALEQKRDPKVQVYPHRIAFNLFPHIGRLTEEMPGYYTEEAKMRRETRKILGDATIQVSATCVRVPVFNAHSEALNVQLERKITPDQARDLLRQMPGVVVLDDPGNAKYPTPIEASGTDPVYVGRIREDTSAENCLDLFCVSDNIRKGAALNAVQIAEKMIEMGLL